MTSMNAVRSGIQAALFLAAALNSGCGCDAGYTYQPVDSDGQPLAEWSQTIEGARFSVGTYSAVIGSKNTIAFIDIDNKSDMRVVVLGGELHTSGRKIEAHVLDDAESAKARSVPAHSGYKRVMLFWQFDAPASELLGPNITWAWHVRVGPAEHTLQIPMGRQAK
jgi:hypothetical protein